MVLTTPVETPVVRLTATAPTVVAPGQRLVVKLVVEARRPCQLLALTWETPDPVPAVPEGRADFPVRLAAGARIEWSEVFVLAADREGFGEMHATLVLLAEGQQGRTAVSWSAWISVFERLHADEKELHDRGRRRLIDVVNARPRNGHIFVADAVSFFDDFLNVGIPERVAAFLAQEFGFSSENLPVDREAYVRFILGTLSWYGMIELELIAEEECVESDDRFDPDAAREVEYEIKL